jgi:hypothetical protein
MGASFEHMPPAAERLYWGLCDRGQRVQARKVFAKYWRPSVDPEFITATPPGPFGIRCGCGARFEMDGDRAVCSGCGQVYARSA